MVAIEIVRENKKLNIALAIPITILISFAIGIMHFILITCQIKETVLRKCCSYCESRCAEKIFLSLLIPFILMLLEEILELNRKLTKP